MPRTIQCNRCGVILNLPAKIAAGKRLKCPKCGTRFVVSQDDASSLSGLPGQVDAANTSFDLEKRPPSRDELPVATSEGDLRDTFDLPLGSGSGRDAERGEATVGSATADAAALFKDDGPSKRRPTAAEARSRARRCVRCGGGVPQGMSLCPTCGTDQETGMHVGLEDDLAPPPPPRPQGPPLHVSVVGGLCATGGLILTLLGVINSTRSESSLQNYSWLVLALVSGFGIYACVQFIRGRSVKLLMLALALGVAVDLIGLIAFPIVQAVAAGPGTEEINPIDPTDSNMGIKGFQEQIDIQKIKWGVTFMVAYAVLSLYLMSPAVKKYVFQARGERGVY
jgi:DNA-directed RNA polymerase subunit RPC12/RpoP